MVAPIQPHRQRRGNTATAADAFCHRSMIPQRTPPILPTAPQTNAATFTPRVRGLKRLAAILAAGALAFSLDFVTRQMAAETSPAAVTTFLPPMIVTPLTTILALY